MQYWIRQGDDVQGPFPAEQIQRWLAAGRITPEMHVSADRISWRLVGEGFEVPSPAPRSSGAASRAARARAPRGGTDRTSRRWPIFAGLGGVLAVVLAILIAQAGRDEESHDGDMDHQGGAPTRDTPAPTSTANPPKKGLPESPQGTAVMAALRWLAAHQSANGGWEGEGFVRWCDRKVVALASDRPTGAGRAIYDPGLTGLVLSTFLANGYTNRGKHPFAKVMSRGLRYLKNIQDPEGCFGPRTHKRYVYNHALAALAMVEAYGMTGSPIFKGSAQRAIDFILLCRNPYMAWRYGVKPGDNDTSVSAWMMLPLASGKLINADARKRGKSMPLTLDSDAVRGAQSWIEYVTSPDGMVGYDGRGSTAWRPGSLAIRFPAQRSEAPTAAAMFTLLFDNRDLREDPQVKAGLARLGRRLPRWAPTAGTIDMVYWQWGTLAAFQAGGALWKAWAPTIKSQIIPNQRMDTDACRYKGSWDPVGVWGKEGGRVYATAMMCLCCSVYYRYGRN